MRSSTASKAMLTIGGLTMFGLLVFGVRSGFEPSESTKHHQPLAAAVLAALTTIVFIVSRKATAWPTFTDNRKIIAGLIGLPIVYLVCWILALTGIPAAITALSGQRNIEDYVVTHKGSGEANRNDTCTRYAVYVTNIDRPSKKKYCATADEWTKLSVGDVISLEARESKFGKILLNIKKPALKKHHSSD